MAGRSKYTQEFRESAVKLVLSEGRQPQEAATNLGVPLNTLMGWLTRARKNLSGGGAAFTPPTEQQMQARLAHLEAENKRLRLERDILKKATAFFAREDGGRP